MPCTWNPLYQKKPSYKYPMEIYTNRRNSFYPHSGRCLLRSWKRRECMAHACVCLQNVLVNTILRLQLHPAIKSITLYEFPLLTQQVSGLLIETSTIPQNNNWNRNWYFSQKMPPCLAVRSFVENMTFQCSFFFCEAGNLVMCRICNILLQWRLSNKKA